MADATERPDRHRRRARRRGATVDDLDTGRPPTGQPEPATGGTPRRTAGRAQRRADGTERGLRGLVGAGRSQLGVSGALRGRDVNRPTEEDLAEAERDVVVVRRHWQPPR